jgi:hypothetical protein
MTRLFEAAAVEDGRRVLDWTGADGRAHRFGVPGGDQ